MPCTRLGSKVAASLPGHLRIQYQSEYGREGRGCEAQIVACNPKGDNKKGKEIRASYHFEVITRVSKAHWDLHRRLVNENSAIFLK